MEQGFENVENLTEKISEKEDRIIQLEKELEKYKQLFADCDESFHLRIQSELVDEWVLNYRYDYKEHPDKIMELSSPDQIIPSCSVGEEMLPESVRLWNLGNLLNLDKDWEIKYYPEIDEVTLYVSKKDKVFNKKDVIN